MALVVSTIQTPRTNSSRPNYHLQTVCIHFSSRDIFTGLEDVVRAAVFLGNNQVDPAVISTGIYRVSQRFTTLNRLRLLSGDPLFAPEVHRSHAQTVCAALREMRRRYSEETLSDAGISHWMIGSQRQFKALIN